MINSVKNSPVVFEKDSAKGRKIVEFDNLEYVHLELEREGKVEAHILPIDVDFFVLEGSATFEIDGTTNNISKGDFIRVFANSSRGVSTSKEQRVKLLVIKNKV